MDDSMPGRRRARSRLTVRVLTAVLGTIGAVLLILGPGATKWIGAGILAVAIVIGFIDGWRGWSERYRS